MAEPGVRVEGRLADGGTAFSRTLPHGTDPEVLAWDLGWVVQQPRDAVRDEAGMLVLTLDVRAAGPKDTAPPVRPRGRDADLRLRAGKRPKVRQRVAAYAVVRSSRGLLATEYSARTAVQGRWGMPGGGLDPGEDPAAAVRREVAEETAQQIELGPLVRVQTSHWVGRSPKRVVEDFHAVRLIYLARCPEPTDPVVLDRDGTTSAAVWVALDAWSELTWTANWQAVLGDLLAAG